MFLWTTVILQSSATISIWTVAHDFFPFSVDIIFLNTYYDKEFQINDLETDLPNWLVPELKGCLNDGKFFKLTEMYRKS